MGRVVQKQNQGHERGHGLDQSGDSRRGGEAGFKSVFSDTVILMQVPQVLKCNANRINL